MKPALSIVIFTVLSGGGLGLAAMLAIFNSLSSIVFASFATLALLLTFVGLASSTFHLANPKNAWRAFSRVKTSWLSREAVAASVFFPLFAGWALLQSLQYPFSLTGLMVLRIMVVVVVILTVFCTAMIYQSLKPIAAWHHPLTAFNYLIFAAQSGAVLYAVAVSVAVHDNATDSSQITHLLIVCYLICILTAIAVIGKLLYYRRIGATADIRVGRAIGFTQAQAKLLDAGHSAPAFLNREFIFMVSAKKLQMLRVLALLLCAVSPLLTAWAVVQVQPIVAVCGALFLFAGLLIERWLFFAEARHAVRAFHGVGAP